MKMSDDRPPLAKRLESLREQNGWTKTLVANKLGLKNMATYANWEYGTREPDLQAIKDLASIYNVTVDFLVDGNSSTVEKKYTDTDLDNMIDNAMSFDGEPINDHDREVIRAYLKGKYGK
ncbi:helix-turn-helix domain-containing protein [Enterococcus sp. 22-H-5-01]|uniref:helix-turn-helix domain-containing protein n=1 Tax=Enterococcus sp. 22-H-5-01 TaxID=3418555 RepID=UPI003D084298